MGRTFSFNDKNMEIKEKDNIDDLKDVIKRLPRKEEHAVTINFSWKIYFFILLILGVIFLGAQLSTVLIFLFLGFVFMSAARPVVNWLMRRKISKGWAVTITYLLSIIIFLGLSSAVLVPLVGQISGLLNILPQWISQVLANFHGFSFGSFSIEKQTILNFINDSVKLFPAVDSFKNVAGALSGVFSTTTMMVSVIIFSMYLVLEHDSLFDLGLIRISSNGKRDLVKKLVLDVERKLGSWLLGQALVSTIAGVFAGILLSIFGVPFALPLAVFVALMDAIPNIGASIGVVPIVLIALITQGPIAAAIILLCLIVYQQMENNLIAPKVMGNAIGLKPVVVMLGVITFLTLFGIGGALIAVPVLVLGQIFYEFYIDLQKLKAKGIV